MNADSSSSVVISNPPPLSFTLKKPKDLPRTSKPWRHVRLPVDILLLTAKDCEFFSCYHFLKNSFKSNTVNLGYVYFGEMGGDQSSKLRVALMKCSEGSTGPGGSLIVAKNAVTKLRPKAVFSVGFCHGLQRSKTKLGDVVVSAKLTQYAPKTVKNGGAQPTGVIRVPVSRDVSHLIKNAAHGWKPPLVNPTACEIQVHCDGEYLSGPEKVRAKSCCEELVKLYPEAIAIEMEGEGVYVAAYDMKIEWVVVKGISGYADGTGCESEEWMSFASAMAASLVENILFDAKIFQSWPNYKGEPADEQIPREEFPYPMDLDVTDEQMPAEEACVEFPCPMTLTVKKGIPSREDLESISQGIAEAWKSLGRRLDIGDSKLTAFHKENEEYAEKPYQMLLHWKEKEGLAANYKVLYDALCHTLVKRKDLAQKFCCD